MTITALEVMSLAEETEIRTRYYSGERIPSPAGGELEALRVRDQEDGSGLVIFECSASSIRYKIRIPGATAEEERAVKAAVEEGGDLYCPRHARPHRLKRVRDALGCARCGVVFGTLG